MIINMINGRQFYEQIPIHFSMFSVMFPMWTKTNHAIIHIDLIHAQMGLWGIEAIYALIVAMGNKKTLVIACILQRSYEKQDSVCDGMHCLISSIVPFGMNKATRIMA